MTQTQKKLKEFWEELLNETDHTAKHGDHTSHSGHFNSESGCGEPPYTGDGRFEDRNVLLSSAHCSLL